jgi:hypothetical protein
MPTFLFVRGGHTRQHIVGIIKGGGPSFVLDFSSCLSTYSTEEEMQALKRFSLRSGGIYPPQVDASLAVGESEIETLAFQPIKDLESFVINCTRTDIGIEPIKSELAFDISKHEAAKTVS